MKNAFYRTFVSLPVVLLLAACSPQVGDTQPASAPEASAIPATAPAAAPEATPTPEPASAATVWFEGRTCGYEGTETLPAGHSLAITWEIRTKVGDIYQLYRIVSEERISEEDVLKSLAGLDAARPAFRAGLVGAGSAKSVADRKVNVLVKRQDGPLQGFLCFRAWDTDTAFLVLGPIELK